MARRDRSAVEVPLSDDERKAFLYWAMLPQSAQALSQRAAMGDVATDTQVSNVSVPRSITGDDVAALVVGILEEHLPVGRTVPGSMSHACEGTAQS